MASGDLTIKQDKFCRAFVGPAEGNASEAYRTAYNTQNCSMATINRSAKELLDNPKIAARVEQLKAEYAAQNAVTIEEITAGLRRAAESAAAAGQHSAATQALLGLAKLSGLLVEKRQVSVDDAREHLDAVAELAKAPTEEPIVQPWMRPDDDEHTVSH
jgi:phage terminase small subunit